MEQLTITQVASTLGVSERTIYRLMDQDELHPVKIGKSWRFDQDEVDAYVEKQRRESAEKLKAKREAAKRNRAENRHVA